MAPTELHSFYAQHFGERWPILEKALLAEEHQVLRKTFSGSVSALDDEPATNASKSKLTLRNDAGKLYYYAMDPASVLAAQALHVAPGDRVLDMCAAPGGKTLILLESIGAGTLVANEISTPRRNRLIKVIRQYVPDALRPQIEVKGKDGLRFGMECPEMFDKVLLDVPCSSERHLLKQGDVSPWTERRSRRLAKKQYGLLSSAFLAVRKGGTFVYCTCSLSPFENEGVVQKLLKRRRRALEIVSDSRLRSLGAEETASGYQFLPDRSGFGPIYFSILKRNDLSE